MIVGIDLGTTNSAIGIWRDGKAQLIRNSLGSFLTPSAVSLTNDGELLVGLTARERQVTHPEVSATTFKRYMGTKRLTRLGSRELLPEELSALVLRSLKADAEKHLGEPVTDAIVTVPAYFNDKQRQATRRAGQLAGLNVLRLLNEPTAAALAYGIHQQSADTRFLVFDLGGGTFDVSVLELFDGVIEVRASTGDNHLGGEDFNELLINRMFAAHRAGLEPTKNTDSKLYQRVRDQAERCRRRLSSESAATMSVTWKNRAFDLEITEEQFAEAAAPLIERLREPVLRALRDSNIPVTSLAEIVLVGGATRMPIVRRAVTKMFGRFPATHVHPDEAVALGAAVQAGLAARSEDLREVVLTDVCPYTLGVDVGERLPNGQIRHGIFAPIIERNTIVPTSREHVFAAIDDHQRVVEFGVYQGESPNVADNIRLGQLVIPLPPGGRSREIAVICRFTYDINGLLEVDVHVPSTGERRELVIMDKDAPMSAEELQRRREGLAKLKVHPRDQETNRAVIARAERCYEQALGERRQFIAHCLSQFMAAIEGQDPRVIDAARAKFSQELDALEGETFL